MSHSVHRDTAAAHDLAGTLTDPVDTSSIIQFSDHVLEELKEQLHKVWRQSLLC
jgi:hypothetical protein